jgi:hypothetical protein
VRQREEAHPEVGAITWFAKGELVDKISSTPDFASVPFGSSASSRQRLTHLVLSRLVSLAWYRLLALLILYSLLSKSNFIMCVDGLGSEDGSHLNSR